jgi:hypothetical protein
VQTEKGKPILLWQVLISPCWSKSHKHHGLTVLWWQHNDIQVILDLVHL